MKNLFLLLFVMLFPVPAPAQELCDEIPCRFQWDAPANLGGITEYRLYFTETPGVYDWAAPLITVPVSETEGAVVALPRAGVWYVVAVSSDGTNISPPSNEIAIRWPLDPTQTPTNLRKITMSIVIEFGPDGQIVSIGDAAGGQ